MKMFLRKRKGSKEEMTRKKNKKSLTSLRLSQVTEEEWNRFAKQTAKRIIGKGLGDGRKRHIGDYAHRRLCLKFGHALPEKENELRHKWFDRVDAEIEKS